MSARRPTAAHGAAARRCAGWSTTTGWPGRPGPGWPSRATSAAAAWSARTGRGAGPGAGRPQRRPRARAYRARLVELDPRPDARPAAPPRRPAGLSGRRRVAQRVRRARGAAVLPVGAGAAGRCTAACERSVSIVGLAGLDAVRAGHGRPARRRASPSAGSPSSPVRPTASTPRPTPRPCAADGPDHRGAGRRDRPALSREPTPSCSPRSPRRGAVMSEVPPGSAPLRNRFLKRNRMIATMTLRHGGRRGGAAQRRAQHGPAGRATTADRSAWCRARCRPRSRPAATRRCARVGRAVTDAAEVAELVGRIGATWRRGRSARPRPDWDDLDEAGRRGARCAAQDARQRGRADRRWSPACSRGRGRGRPWAGSRCSALAEKDGTGWRGRAPDPRRARAGGAACQRTGRQRGGEGELCRRERELTVEQWWRRRAASRSSSRSRRSGGTWRWSARARSTPSGPTSATCATWSAMPAGTG